MNDVANSESDHWVIYHWRKRPGDRRGRRQYLQGFTAISGMPSWGSKAKSIHYPTKDAVKKAWTQCNYLCNNPGDIHYQKVNAKTGVV